MPAAHVLLRALEGKGANELVFLFMDMGVSFGIVR